VVRAGEGCLQYRRRAGLRVRRRPVVTRGVRRTTAALRFSPRSFARFIGEPLNAAPSSVCVMPNSSRANRTFHGHTSWDVWRYTRFEIRLETGGNTLARRRRE
jgi:hypothetical protein